MNLRRVKQEDSYESQMIIGMILNKNVLSQLIPLIDLKLMETPKLATLAKWCIEYYTQTEDAPKNHIQDIFLKKKQFIADEAEVDLLETLLDKLNTDYINAGIEINEDFVLASSIEHLQKVKAKALMQDVANLIETGKVEEAQNLLVSYIPPKISTSEEDYFLSDKYWDESDEVQEKPLFEVPSAFGEVLGAVEKDSLISILAGEKVGKTWILFYLSLMALRQRNNVILFSTGDMTRKQVRRRFKHMLTGINPKRRKEKILYPVIDCTFNQRGNCPFNEFTDPVCDVEESKGKKPSLGKPSIGSHERYPDHIICTKCQTDPKRKYTWHPTTWMQEKLASEYEKDFKTVKEGLKQRSKNADIVLQYYKAGEKSLTDLKNEVHKIEKKTGKFFPVIVIDYADLLASEPSSGRKEERHLINDTWKALRAFSQEGRAVITATQAKGAVRVKGRVDQTDVAEDKRKLAHVTGLIGLSQTAEEKKRGVLRVASLAQRDDAFDEKDGVFITQCLAVGNPHIESFWINEQAEQEERKRLEKLDKNK